MSYRVPAFAAWLAGGVALGLAGCQTSPIEPGDSAQAVHSFPDPEAPRLEPAETTRFEMPAPGDEMLGTTQVLFARYEDTFSAIAREYNLGFEEMRAANPGVDEWIPGEGTPIYLPTQIVLPDAPREGIVLNTATMRLFFFTDGEVTTYPVGIGRVGWATPTGSGTVTAKAVDPAWYVPASIQKEHAELGDPLPAVVPPGPDNPLGSRALALSLPGYLIHGTNKPAGVGMRVSHGCVRLYPEDVEALFDRVERGTPVHIVDQPVVAGWSDGQLYLEVHPPLQEDDRDLTLDVERVLARALERGGESFRIIDRKIVERIIRERRGIPFPVLIPTPSPTLHLASTRIIENTTPVREPETTVLAQPEVPTVID